MPWSLDHVSIQKVRDADLSRCTSCPVPKNGNKGSLQIRGSVRYTRRISHEGGAASQRLLRTVYLRQVRRHHERVKRFIPPRGEVRYYWQCGVLEDHAGDHKQNSIVTQRDVSLFTK